MQSSFFPACQRTLSIDFRPMPIVNRKAVMKQPNVFVS